MIKQGTRVRLKPRINEKQIEGTIIRDSTPFGNGPKTYEVRWDTNQSAYNVLESFFEVIE